jgi:hypothetical protein
MSEYQYYEFQAIDRRLSEADRKALRALSTRARITSSSFTNSYEWGDFRGDPSKLMERWFDLHLYFADWGLRRLMIKLPAAMVDRGLLDSFNGKVEDVKLSVAGENLILDIVREDEEPGEVVPDDSDDETSRLGSLAPLRGDLLAGDFRLFYLLWLIRVEAGEIGADEPEPLPGIGPMTEALEAFADFFNVDPDLVAAAAERSSHPITESSETARPIVAAMIDSEKTGLLVRLLDGDPHVASELRTLVRRRLMSERETPHAAARTADELRERADAFRLARDRAEAEKAEAARQRLARETERARRARLDAIARRGHGIWDEIEAEIERLNASGYDKAAGLLIDLGAIAEEKGTTEDFARRLGVIRERHAQKARFIERLAQLG